MTTFKIVFTFDIFFSTETTMHCKRHFTDNKSCQVIESILKYKNGFENNLMHKEIFN
jgi:hypothetical protein